MQWIHNYQLFLFDFDGLLVNTEELHYQAYINMCANRGFNLPWDFKRYSLAAHYYAEGLREQIYAELPALLAQEPDWSVLYQEKKRLFIQSVEQGAVQLMPGAYQLLGSLQKSNIKHCVVTHSAIELIQAIRKQHPVLDAIPHWITREDYKTPKPSPECYLTAIQRLAHPEDKIIGFEDIPRGLNALKQTRAKAVLICPSDSAYLPELLKQEISHYPSLEAISTG